MELEPAKVVIVGDSGVGKTSIINVFAGDEFESLVQPTIVTSNVLKDININGTNITLNIWDTAGQERFQSLIPLYLRAADACVFVADVSDANAIEVLDNVWDLFKQNSDDRCYCILCGNKTDLVPDDFQTTQFEAWAKNHNMSFVPTSAKTGENIELVFNDIAVNIIDRRSVLVTTKVDITETDNFNKPRKCC